jgi:hypothetical protein
MNIVIKRWDTGDWVEVYVEGREVYRGHSIPDFIFEELLEKLGARIVTEKVADEE